MKDRANTSGYYRMFGAEIHDRLILSDSLVLIQGFQESFT